MFKYEIAGDDLFVVGEGIKFGITTNEENKYLYVSTVEGRFYAISKEHGLQELVPYYKNDKLSNEAAIAEKLRNGKLELVWEIRPASSIEGECIHEFFAITEEKLQSMTLKDESAKLTELNLPHVIQMDNKNKAEEIEAQAAKQRINPNPTPISSMHTYPLPEGCYRQNSFLKETSTPAPSNNNNTPASSQSSTTKRKSSLFSKFDELSDNDPAQSSPKSEIISLSFDELSPEKPTQSRRIDSPEKVFDGEFVVPKLPDSFASKIVPQTPYKAKSASHTPIAPASFLRQSESAHSPTRASRSLTTPRKGKRDPLTALSDANSSETSWASLARDGDEPRKRRRGSSSGK